MKREHLSGLQTVLILGGAATMLSLAMGMRQSWGLFQPHLIRDIGITAADFSLAIAIQNIVWGTTQPFVGMLADRHGARPVALAGVVIYAAGLLVSLYSTSALTFTVDLSARTVTAEGVSVPFAIPEGVREAFVSGRWDGLSLLLERLPAAREVAARLPYGPPVSTGDGPA